MDLDELAVGVAAAGLEHPADRAAVAGHRVGRAAEDQPAAAGGDDQGVGRKRADLHAHQVLGYGFRVTANAGTTGRPKLIMLIVTAKH